MSKTLLIIGAGIEQVPGIKLAKKMGLRVVVTDCNLRSRGFKYADDFAVISTYDIEETVNFAVKYNRKKKINGVMTLAADVPLTVAAVAAELGVPGNSLKTAKLASNKLLMKRRFAEDNIPIPEFCEVKNINDIKKFVRRYKYPIVLKPVDSRGARGVLKLTEEDDLNKAFNISINESPIKQIMVEKFLEGPQLSTESIVYDGKIFTPGLANRNYEFLEKFKPYIIENGGDLPVCLDKKQREMLNGLLLKSAKSLGVKRGSIKGDIVYANGGFKIIEIAARLSGGWFCTDEIPLSTGVNIIKAVIDISLGLIPDFNELIPRYHRGVALRYIFSDKGMITNISGLDKAKKVPCVRKIGVNIITGNIINEISNHTKRVGFVIAVSDKRKEAIKNAKKAVSFVQVKTIRA